MMLAFGVDPQAMKAFMNFLEHGNPNGPGRMDFRLEALADVAAFLKQADAQVVDDLLRARNRDAAAVALALCASLSQTPLKRAALHALPAICDTSDRLFLFCSTLKGLRGWGRGLRAAVARWYTERTPAELEALAREPEPTGEWTHRDLLRLSHPRPTSAEQADALRLLSQRR